MNRKLLFTMLTCIIFNANAYPGEGVFGAIGDSFDTLINQQEMILALAQSFTDCCSSSTATLCFNDTPPPLVYTDIGQADIPFVIASSGNYRVTENLDGTGIPDPLITVDADDVLLEIDNFTLDCATSALEGIMVVNGHENIVIQNGTIINAIADGISINNSIGVIITNCTSSNNASNGFHLAAATSGAFLESCGGTGNTSNTYAVTGTANVIGLQNCTDTSSINFSFAVGPAFGDMGNNS